MGGRSASSIVTHVAAVFAVTAGLIWAAPLAFATSSPGMPYSMEDFGAQLLSTADVQALINTPPLQDVAGSPSCSLLGGGGYNCRHEWPIPPYTYARPEALTIQSHPSPTAAQTAFAQRKAALKSQAGLQSIIFDGADDASISANVDALHFGVTSLRRAGNNIVEATCVSRTSPGDRVENVNTCTQAMINAQAPKIAGFVAPKLEVPGPPSGVLTSSNGPSITVTWLPPASDGGTPITGYTAQSSPDGLTCSSTPSATELQACTATNGKPGTNYSFTVVATNAVGTGPNSTASKPNKYLTKPSAPLAVKARANGVSASVQWTKPKESGGLAVQQYVVTGPGGVGCRTATTSCIVEGLQYSMAYTFSVKAVNGRGSGPAGASNPVKTGPAPDKPAASLS